MVSHYQQCDFVKTFLSILPISIFQHFLTIFFIKMRYKTKSNLSGENLLCFLKSNTIAGFPYKGKTCIKCLQLLCFFSADSLYEMEIISLLIPKMHDLQFIISLL